MQCRGNSLTTVYRSKENVPLVLVIYTDGGPEHCNMFLSMKIAIVALQKYLDLDLILTCHTVPEHSVRNPAQKINCDLNLGLSGKGCTHYQSNNIHFKKSLYCCMNLSELHNVIDKNKEKYSDLLRKCMTPF